VPVILMLARLVLAGVLLVAAVAKLADRRESRRAMAAFGLPARLAGPAAILVPAAEAAVAVALIVPAWARWGAVAALALLGAFTAGIALNLARGRAPDCHCFGRLAGGPVGGSTVARNAALAVLAGLVVWRGPGGPHLGALSTADELALAVQAVLAVLVAALGLLVLSLFRQQGRILLRLDALESMAGPERGLPVGEPAPDVRLRRLEGGTATVSSLPDGSRPVMLVFVSPTCGPCRELVPEVARWQRDHAAAFAVALISEGTEGENRSWAELGVANVLIQQDGEATRAYLVHGTPSAVLVSADGRIESPVREGAPAIRTLVRETRTLVREVPARPEPARPEPAEGSPLPQASSSFFGGRRSPS
jgi:thiol-disulfide isomerase/thioredoxin/uncharacterized membrane protein YphA (DoxX/SURF4 family)